MQTQPCQQQIVLPQSMEETPSSPVKLGNQEPGSKDIEAPHTPDLRPLFATTRRSHSPINLPVRTDSLRSPTLQKSPRTPQIIAQQSPRRSFYLENSIPTYDEVHSGKQPTDPDLQQQAHHQEVQLDSQLNDELIFDDGDERLPPPVPSPTYNVNTEPDALAVSSPELDDPGVDGYIDHYEEADFPPVNFESERSISKPRHLLYSPDSADPNTLSPSEFDLHRDHSTYYPAPVPLQLMRPPKLRGSNKGRHRNRALSFNGFPEPPAWGPGLLENEIEYYKTPELPQDGFPGQPQSVGDEGEYRSDVESDRATVMSSDRDDEFEAMPAEPTSLTSSDPKNKRKSKRWLANLFGKRKNHESEAVDENGEKYDSQEAETLLAQMAVIDNDMAFTRLDPETIQRHSQMFNAGGIHGSVAPHAKGSTSLIEELEIRKAGRKVQYQVFTREVAEIERQRAEDNAAPGRLAHPVDLVDNVQPTLMQMKHMADVDYNTRVNWHTRMINRSYINEHGDETLAQRRARLKAEKNMQVQSSDQETLAQRRERLRRQKKSANRPVELTS